MCPIKATRLQLEHTSYNANLCMVLTYINIYPHRDHPQALHTIHPPLYARCAPQSGQSLSDTVFVFKIYVLAPCFVGSGVSTDSLLSVKYDTVLSRSSSSTTEVLSSKFSVLSLTILFASSAISVKAYPIALAQLVPLDVSFFTTVRVLYEGQGSVESNWSIIGFIGIPFFEAIEISLEMAVHMLILHYLMLDHKIMWML